MKSPEVNGPDGTTTTTAEQAGPRWSLPRGKVLHRARQNDPALQYFVYVPAAAGPGAPVFVGVHGISRNGLDLARLFSPQCDRVGAVLVAPHFSQGHSADYQRLGRAGRGPRADLALHSILDEVAWLTGASTAQIHLFGFSGGAQFAHRYAMAHPHRVARAVVAASGWYTFPDARTRYPYGTRTGRSLPDVRFDPEEFLQVPVTVIVGEEDTATSGVRRTRRASAQGANRAERARNWVEAMRATARACRIEPQVNLETIPGGGHSFSALMKSGGLGDRTFAALFGTSPPSRVEPRP